LVEPAADHFSEDQDIQDHQDFNRAVAASYAMLTGCTVRYIKNPDFLLEKAVEEMVQVLR